MPNPPRPNKPWGPLALGEVHLRFAVHLDQGFGIRVKVEGLEFRVSLPPHFHWIGDRAQQLREMK